MFTAQSPVPRAGLPNGSCSVYICRVHRLTNIQNDNRYEDIFCNNPYNRKWLESGKPIGRGPGKLCTSRTMEEDEAALYVLHGTHWYAK